MCAPQLRMQGSGRHQILQRLLQEGARDRTSLQLQASRLPTPLSVCVPRARTVGSVARLARAYAPALATALVLFCTATAQSPSGLQRLLDAELARFPGRAGVWVKHLTTGEEAGVRADDTFNSASVIKIPVMVLAYQLADKSRLSLDERITVNKEDVRSGSGVFRHHDVGLQPTLRDVLMQMVITSDNTATDLAIAKVGGVGAVNAWIAEHGYADGMRL